MERIKEFFVQKDKLAQYLGMQLLEVVPGTAKVKMDIAPCHLNGVKTVHGGAIFSLADFAFAVASNSHGTVAVAINVNISFLKAATEGALYAHAREVACNPKLGHYQVDITDQHGDLVATFQGLAYRKKDKLIDDTPE